MVLSAELINQFVKATKDTETKKSETIVYGTVVQKPETINERNETVFVQFDGSELPTPVISTSDTKVDDRVTVMIKNHTAIITGNVSSPSARTDDVKDIKTDVNIDLSGVKRELINQGNQVTAQSKLITEHGQFLTSLDSRADTQEATVKDIKDVVDMITTVAEEHDLDVETMMTTIQQTVDMINSVSEENNETIKDVINHLTEKIGDIYRVLQTYGSDIMDLQIRVGRLEDSQS